MNQLQMQFTPLPLAQRVRTARKLGEEAGQRCVDKAEDTMPDFSERALKFIVDHVREKGRVSGESIVLAATAAGIRPPDARAFGPVFKKALSLGLIRVVGFVPRVRGHGSAGGKLYAPGY